MVQRLRASLARGPLADSVPHILVGCSGGMDSVVLAYLIHALVRTGSIRGSLVHVDHRVREDSPEAVSLVRQLGATLQIPVIVRQLDPGVIAGHAGSGPEEAMRRERYRAYEEVSSDVGGDAIALAHHQRDQAETVLLHLIRGAGLQGASGMREWADIPVPWWSRTERPANLRVWRPLLVESIDEISSIHHAANLPVAEDSTNVERTYRRNAIRHDILPALEEIVAGATRNLARFAGIAASDNDYLEQLASERLVLQPDGDLHRSAITEADPAMRRRVARQWIMSAGFDGDLTSDRIDAVCTLAARNRSGAEVQIGNRWLVAIHGGILSIRRESGYH